MEYFWMPGSVATWAVCSRVSCSRLPSNLEETKMRPGTLIPGLRVPGRIFVSSRLLGSLEHETLEQTAHVATLPGIQKYSMAMPDAHSGYGFPIGGVAAFDRDTGIISPGGDCCDINTCG